MQQREKILFIVFLVSIAIWQGSRWIDASFLQPLREKQQELYLAQERVQSREKQEEELLQASRSLADWRARSLPPEPLDAQRLYQQWLTDLAQLSGLSGLKVTPERRVAKGKTYVAVQVALSGQATYPQLSRFLYHFQRADLAHRVVHLRVESPATEGNPLLNVSLTAEGLAVQGAKNRARLFPQARLAAPIDAKAASISVVDQAEFSQSVPFDVRIDGELLTVREQSGNRWTVTRGAEATAAAPHAAGAAVELFPRLQTARVSLEEVERLMARSPFVKPSPPIVYRPQIADLPPLSVIRGNVLKFTVRAFGFDPQQGRPVYRLAEGAPVGMTIDAESGSISWRPDESIDAGEHTVRVLVGPQDWDREPLSKEFRVAVLEPNQPPFLAPLFDLTIHYGEEARLTAFALDGDEPPHRLKFALGPGAPPGASIDAESGEFLWRPPATVKPGEYPVTITVMDDGQPPLGDEATFVITLEDDSGQHTFLVACFSEGGRSEAWLYDRLHNKRTIVTPGQRLQLAHVDGTVEEIGPDFIRLQTGRGQFRLKLGQHLRALTPISPVAAPDRESPAITRPVSDAPAIAPQPAVPAGP